MTPALMYKVYSDTALLYQVFKAGGRAEVEYKLIIYEDDLSVLF